MKGQRPAVFCLAVLAAFPARSALGVKAPDRLPEFQRQAGRFGAIIRLPEFETNTNEVRALVRETMATGDAALDRIAALPPGQGTFANTVVALDDSAAEATLAMKRLRLLKETSPSAALREAAAEALKALQEWEVGREYRADVYRTVRAFADTRPNLRGEDAKLLAETLRDYRRAGMELPQPRRDRVERMRKELSRLATDFESNISQAQRAVKFGRAELEGVPDRFLQQSQTGADEHTVLAHVTWQYLLVMENARREETRRRLLVERENLARAPNLPLLEKILLLRHQIATELGYQSWADYQTEVKMTRKAATALEFLDRLRAGLEPKFSAELAEFRRLKVKATGDPQAQIRLWDWRYFANEWKKERYAVDAEQLRVYFPYGQVLDGLFGVCQSVFGLRIERVEPPEAWVEGLRLYAVSDARTREPLGLFYLDMFPREGKYNHFAVMGLIDGKLMADGKYQRPVCVLVCNFPPPSKDQPSLLSHDDVETLFHEFGHALHSILTRAKYARFSGTNVPGDFVEAPSQVLEQWVWDKAVLDSFAADYRDPARKVPAETLARLEDAKLAIEGTRYRRQLAFGLTDLALHTKIDEGNAADVLPLSNQVLSEVFLPVAPDTAFVASFGHLMGYDAGYYGYAWADAIAADLATVFEHSRRGYLDPRAGRRLRREIYEPGDSRDVGVSIERFLGRQRSLDPFFKKIGIEAQATPVAAGDPR